MDEIDNQVKLKNFITLAVHLIIMVIREDKEAVTPILSMILLIMIMLVVTAGIIQWATPTVQNAQYEAQYRAARGYFEILDSAIEDAVVMGSNSGRSAYLSIGAGEIYFGKTETWIVAYGLNKSLRIGFFGLEDGDKNLSINSTQEGTNVNISVYWPEGDNLGEPYYPLEYQTPTPVITASKDLVGTVYIRVNNSSTQKSLAELWLFDINCIEYKLASPLGTYYIRAENAGIVTQAIGERWVCNKPMFQEGDSTLLMWIANFTKKGISSGGAGDYHFNIRAQGGYVRASRSVYNLTLQICYGDYPNWAETWYSYFLEGYEAAQISGGESGYKGFITDSGRLFYKTVVEANETKLKLIQCSAELEMAAG